jgi:hypothetical protein
MRGRSIMRENVLRGMQEKSGYSKSTAVKVREGFNINDLCNNF